MARQPGQVVSATVLLSILYIVPGNGNDVCYQSQYVMGGICRNPSSPTHIRATACYNSSVEEECITGVGRMVESLLTRTACEQSLSQRCEIIGGQLATAPSCNHWCDAIGKSSLELCPNGTGCNVSSTSQCPEGLDASFFTGIERQICCADFRMLLDKGCVEHDCEQLVEYTSDPQRTGSTPSGCSTARDCTKLELDVGPFGLPFVENTYHALQTRFRRCLRQQGPTTGCYTASQRLPSICATRNITWRFCAASQRHAQQCMEEMGSVAESLVTLRSCRSHISSVCTAAGGTRKCTGNATCNFVCDALDRMPTLAGCVVSNECPRPPFDVQPSSVCCHSTRRLITDSCQGVSGSAANALVGRMASSGLLQTPCNSTTPCIEPAVCTPVPLRLDYCDMLDGQSVFSQSVINDAFSFQEAIRISWDRLQPENFDKSRNCQEAFRQWLCTFNSRPCANAAPIPLCLDFCVAFQMCNRSLAATLGVNGTSDDPEVAAIRICESMGIEPFTNRPGLCFNSRQRPNIRGGSVPQTSASMGLVASAVFLSSWASMWSSMATW